MMHPRFRFWPILLLATLWLVSCSGITSIPGLPTPRPIPTITPLPTTGIQTIQGISCKQGVQLILQKQVRSVTIISVLGTPSELTVAEIDLYMPNGERKPINDFYQCDTKLEAAIAKVNPTLPKNQQIVVKRTTTLNY